MSEEKPSAESVVERVQPAESSLEALESLSRRLLDALIATAPTPIVLTDSRGRIARFNAACAAMTGYSREEALGKTIPELFRTSGWANPGPAPFADSRDSTPTIPQVSHWLTKTGEKRLIEWRCTAVASPKGDEQYVLGVGLDVTHRRQALDAAVEARQFAENIIATVREPILVLDDGLCVQAANRSFYRAFQVEPAEIIGRPFFELGDRHWEIPALRQLLEPQLLQHASFDNFEVALDFPRVGRRIMLLKGRRVLREEGGAGLILLAMEDATDKVQARDALQRLNRELEDRVRERTAELQAANKELEAFCFSVSHDLRAPLRALDGFSDELLRRYGPQFDEQGRHYLQRLRSGTQRMGELIDDLLQLSRFSRGEMKREPVDLSSLARAVAAELRQREPERQVSFDVQPDLTCQGDPGLLKAALENLLGNAWKFTGKKAAAAIAFGRTTHQESTAYFVRDDGAGFDMTHAAKLFGAFQRLHSQREFPGNGVGLATVQRIVHRHGGQIWAESAPGLGAAFYFTLPTKESA